MKKYIIWGMGLLGTSLALELKKKGADVVGIEKSMENIEILRKLNFDKIHQADDETFFEEIGNCNGIIIGTPVDQVYSILEKLSVSKIPQTCWITDMASTKNELMYKFTTSQNAMISRLNFIGSHPMAGSDLSGPAHARHDLFSGATIYITPPESNSEKNMNGVKETSNSIQQVMEFWKNVGAQPFVISSEVHDKWAAYLSHGLHLVSCMVSHMLENIPEVYNLKIPPAAGSFRDITRVAGSNPKLWDGIINSNAKEVTKYLDSLEKLIHDWKLLLAEKKLPVEDIFKKSAVIRAAIIKN
ncbi:MAG: prephenate dehydrogenase/arogenate dehydrogenase family protein [Spirochaetia bacterium]|nr:prephenate dehydrogenase/arogenate dehydrogenase family protein [Spirochaetia bacterium]